MSEDPPWVYFIWYSLCFLDLSDSFPVLGKVLAVISSNIFSLSLILVSLINMCLGGVPPLVYFIWYSLHSLDLSEWFLFHVREVFGSYFSEYFFCPLFYLFSFWHPHNTDVGAFNVVPEFSETLFISFPSFLFRIGNLF